MSSDDPTITDQTQREFEALADLLRSAGRRIDPPDAARQQSVNRERMGLRPSRDAPVAHARDPIDAA